MLIIFLNNIMQTGQIQPDREAGWPVSGIRCHQGEESGDYSGSINEESRNASDTILWRGVCDAGWRHLEVSPRTMCIEM